MNERLNYNADVEQRGSCCDGQGFSLSQRLRIGVISLLGWGLIQVLGRTLRFRVEGWNNYDRFHSANKPVILSFWHNQIPTATFFWRHRGIVVITSEHFDGEYIARIIRKFGYGTARGSSSRGAVRALLKLKRRLSEGHDVAFTIDGPRGPRYEVKPGPPWLAARTGAPLVCFHIEPERFWELGSWDRMRIPKPFSRVLVQIAPPLQPDSASSEDQQLRLYQEQMDRLQRACVSSVHGADSAPTGRDDAAEDRSLEDARRPAPRTPPASQAMGSSAVSSTRRKLR